MRLEDDRQQLIAQARGALGMSAADVDDAARRFAARLELDEQRGGWRSAPEFAPMVRTWGRVMLLGAIGIAVVAVTMARCPLYERAITPPPVTDPTG